MTLPEVLENFADEIGCRFLVDSWLDQPSRGEFIVYVRDDKKKKALVTLNSLKGEGSPFDIITAVGKSPRLVCSIKPTIDFLSECLDSEDLIEIIKEFKPSMKKLYIGYEPVSAFPIIHREVEIAGGKLQYSRAGKVCAAVKEERIASFVTSLLKNENIKIKGIDTKEEDVDRFWYFCYFAPHGIAPGVAHGYEFPLGSIMKEFDEVNADNRHGRRTVMHWNEINKCQYDAAIKTGCYIYRREKE